MTDLIHNAMRWLADQQASHASRTVSIQRGSNTTSGVTALKATSDFGSRTEGVVIEDWQGRDWLIRPQHYRIDAAAVEPQRGDRIIEETDDGKTTVYEVAPPAGLPDYELTRDAIHYRVHTKIVSEF